jgi:hypothetical protein
MFFTGLPLYLSSTQLSANPNFGLVAERIVPKLLSAVSLAVPTCRNSRLIQMCNTNSWSGPKASPTSRIASRSDSSATFEATRWNWNIVAP